MKLLLAAILALGAVGCTASPYMRDADPTGAPGPDQAKVVVYRTAVMGGVENFPVYVVQADETRLLGFTETDAYFEARLAPGPALFIASGEGDAFIEADLQPGHTYTLRSWSKFGLVTARPGFAPVSKDSQSWRELELVRPQLQARELDPKRADLARRRTAERATEALDEYRSGLHSAKKAWGIHALPPDSAHGQ